VLQSRTAGILLRIALVAILIYMIFLLVHVRQQITATQAEIRTLTEEVADQTQTNTELTNAIENRDDPAFLKDVARERLDLVTPNDRVFYITD
jgi:cell division protein FtsL